MRIFIMALMALALVGTVACKHEGPLEKAGKKVDEAFQKASDSLEDESE